jgi:hypothetical protein
MAGKFKTAFFAFPGEPTELLTTIESAAETARASKKISIKTCTDTENYFVSEASVYRLLKAHDLIASPASSSLAIQAATLLLDHIRHWPEARQAGHAASPEARVSGSLPLRR